MFADLDHAPRLAQMQKLVSLDELSQAVSSDRARLMPPLVTSAAELEGRVGYEPGFLGEFVVPWPEAVKSAKADLLHISGSAQSRLDYTHFSIAMSVSRRMAMFVGVNIDGGDLHTVARGGDRWSFDGRIALDAQLGDDLYAGNPLDRGHLVRRQDPNWGDEAEIANQDSFHFTNCAPQMAGFNQKTWLGLEDHLLENTRRWRERVTIFSGPVFREDDRLYRGARIPSAFWKVIAFLSDAGKPSATAYMIDQRGELDQLEITFGPFQTYQRSVRRIEQVTGISFGALRQYDGFSNEELATGTRIEAQLTSPADMRV